MVSNAADVAARIRQFILSRYGRVDERLMASGLIDSLRAVELAIALEQEFGLPADSFVLSDMATITALSARILSVQGGPQSGAQSVGGKE